MYLSRRSPGPFNLLERLFGDPVMAEVFSEDNTIDSWLRVEGALARAQARHGVITSPEAEQIAVAANLRSVDVDALWAGAQNVGYPILTLVRQISAALPEGPSGKVHLGATTQDIMDTGRVLQLKRGLDRLTELVDGLGDALAVLVERHRNTEMAARTHAQQAVPTTLGQLLATLLAELTRHRMRLVEVRPRIEVVSLFGGGGTSAAMGPVAADVRRALAELLDLGTTDVSWHPARDGSAEFAAICAGLAATCGRLARNVIDLSRTEIGELHEPGGRHRGASSTMPNKSNPTWSAAVIGMSGTAAALASAVYRAMEVPQERASGEWHIEWVVLPQLACLAAGALARAADIVGGLRVDTQAMADNLRSNGGLIMAEAYMMRLAPTLGRERSHDLVTRAAGRVFGTRLTLADALRIELKENGTEDGEGVEIDLDIEPGDYVGTPELPCAQAIRDWHATRGSSDLPGRSSVPSNEH